MNGMEASLILRIVLAPFTVPYRFIVQTRNALFNHGYRAIHRVSVPVISIGNLTTGGTGKTPMVAFVVRELQRLGKTPGIVSRGYRALADGTNDEFKVLAQLCPGVPHVQHRQRIVAAERLLAEHPGVDVLVMDDAFQHRQMHRDLDIVLIDATNPFGGNALLPVGRLREPKSSLKRADVVVITRCEQVGEATLKQIEGEIWKYVADVPAVRANFEPTRLIRPDGTAVPIEDVTASRCGALCGIGNPEAFRRTLGRMGIEVAEESLRAFPDHHHYTQADVEELREWSQSQTFASLLTTQKDLVKLRELELDGLNLLAVTLETQLTSQEAMLQEKLQKLFSLN